MVERLPHPLTQSRFLSIRPSTVSPRKTRPGPSRATTPSSAITNRNRKADFTVRCWNPLIRAEFDPQDSSAPSSSSHPLLSLHNHTREYQKHIFRLQSLLHQAKHRIRDLTPPFNSEISPRQRYSLVAWEKLWKDLLTNSGLDFGYVKRDLAKRIAGKTHFQVESILSDSSINSDPQEIRRLLNRFTIGNVIDTPSFLSELTRHQPYPLYEDIEGKLDDFRLHFAVRNVRKSELVAILRDKLPLKCAKAKAVRVLTETAEIGLPKRLAELFVCYFCQRRTKVRSEEITLVEFQEWQTLREVVDKMKLEMAIRDVRLIDVPCLLPIPVTRCSLQPCLISKFFLSAHESDIVLHYLFPPGSLALGPILTVSDMMKPGWRVKSDVDVDRCMGQLADYMGMKELQRIGELQKPLSASLISLSGFLRDCEASFGVLLTPDQRFAIQISSYQHTKVVDGMRFSFFVGQISQNILTKQHQMTPGRPLISEDMSEVRENPSENAPNAVFPH